MNERWFGDCAVMDLARRIAEWVGDGKPVTPKGVLKPADLRQAAAALGVAVPEKFRSGGDVPSWHVPWSVAVATGMLTVERGRAASAAVELTTDEWLRGFVAALTVVFGDGDTMMAARVGRAALLALADGEARDGASLFDAVWRVLDHGYWPLWRTTGFDTSDTVLLELFVDFGVAEASGELTGLGRWALAQMIDRGDRVVPGVAEGKICQLKITLERVSPPCWRRVLVPAAARLGELHLVIQAAMRWDDCHLHDFVVGQRRYGDPSFEMEDESDVALGDVFSAAQPTIRYTYDFGDDWRHEVTLEQVLDPDPAGTYPVCVAGGGAVPVEDSSRKTIKFDPDDINRRLSGLPAMEEDPVLDKVIEMIVVDAYGVDEQLAAFHAAFEDEVEVPTTATVLGNAVTVLEFDYAEPVRGLFVRCREGEVSLVDVCFPPDTVAAWIHAAFRCFLGLKPFPAVPRPDWSWPNW